MLFDENNLIEEGLALVVKIEENLRKIKVEYQKALKDYERLKNGDPDIYETMENEYLNLLAKLQKAIKDTSDLWDRSIANVEVLKTKKKEKAEYFLTGVFWTISLLDIEEEEKTKLLDQAKQLIK